MRLMLVDVDDYRGKLQMFVKAMVLPVMVEPRPPRQRGSGRPG